MKLLYNPVTNCGLARSSTSGNTCAHDHQTREDEERQLHRNDDIMHIEATATAAYLRAVHSPKHVDMQANPYTQGAQTKQHGILKRTLATQTHTQRRLAPRENAQKTPMQSSNFNSTASKAKVNLGLRSA